MVTQTNHQLNYICSEKYIDIGICLRMGKTNTAKTSSDDFKVTTPKNPLLSQQTVTNKGIPIPYTNL